LQILPLSSAPDLGLLPALPCMGPNTPLHIQVSVSLVTYKPNVSGEFNFISLDSFK
jgi:hypothetical protein